MRDVQTESFEERMQEKIQEYCREREDWTKNIVSSRTLLGNENREAAQVVSSFAKLQVPCLQSRTSCISWYCDFNLYFIGSRM